MCRAGMKYTGTRRSFNNGKVQGYMITETWEDGTIRAHYLSIWGGGIMECFHYPMEMRLVKVAQKDNKS